jgi:hypothetical protein
MIALAVDITLDSPRVYPVASAIISKLICSIKDESLRMNILKKIKKRFERIPNTGYLQVWLQRISYHHELTPFFKQSIPLKSMSGISHNF